MTRLIDAEMLMEWVTNWLKMDHYYHSDEKRNDIPIMELKDIIDRLPTVDAVPVEWIKKFTEKSKRHIQGSVSNYTYMYDYMLSEWEQRKEE